MSLPRVGDLSGLMCGLVSFQASPDYLVPRARVYGEMKVNRNSGLLKTWCCPDCRAFLSPTAIARSEALSLLDAHKKECRPDPRRRPNTLIVPCLEPGCSARPRVDHLARHLEKHKAKKGTASVPPTASPALSQLPKAASPKIFCPPSANIVAAPRPSISAPSKKEDQCPHCHWIMPAGYLPVHLKESCPARRPGTIARLPFRLLPPGVCDVDRILDYYRGEASHWLDGRAVDEGRLRRIIERLNPSRRCEGTEGHLGYILFEFPWSRAVVLECPVEGNATYILWGEWRGMLQLTKAELRLMPNCLRVIITQSGPSVA